MEFVKKYVRTATRAQLIVKKDELQEALRKGRISDPDVVLEARAAIKEIERELVARWEVAVLKRRRMAAQRS